MKASKIKILGHSNIFLLLPVFAYIVPSFLDHETPIGGNFREFSVQTGWNFNETGMGLFGYIFEDKSNVPWNYVLIVWLRGVLNSFPGNRCPTWNVLVLKRISSWWIIKFSLEMVHEIGFYFWAAIQPILFSLTLYFFFFSSLLGSKIQELY